MCCNVPVMAAMPPPPSLQASLWRVLLPTALRAADGAQGRKAAPDESALAMPRARGANALPCPPRYTRKQAAKLPPAIFTCDRFAGHVAPVYTQRAWCFHPCSRVLASTKLGSKRLLHDMAPVLVVTCRFMPCGPRARRTRNSIKHTDVTDSIMTRMVQ